MDVPPQPEQKPLKNIFDATEPYHQRAYEEPHKSNKEARKLRQNDEKNYIILKKTKKENISYFQAFYEWWGF